VLVVVDELRLAAQQRREVDAEHRGLADEQVATEPRADGRRAAELLVELAGQRLLVGLVALDLAARELPQPGQVRRCCAPGLEHLAVPQQGGTDHRDPHPARRQPSG
jgi:hypothetical protein